MNQAFSKIWIPIILVIIIVAGGVFTWQYFGAPEETTGDETADWQTYRNEEYGFEIKYPRGTEIVEIDEGYTFFDIPFDLNGTKLTEKILDIIIETTEFKSGIEVPADCIPARPHGIIDSIVINDVVFIKSDISGDFAGMESAAHAIEYCAMKGDLAFKLVFSLPYPRYSQLPDFDREKESIIFEQILSTFRFVE